MVLPATLYFGQFDPVFWSIQLCTFILNPVLQKIFRALRDFLKSTGLNFTKYTPMPSREQL